MAQMSRFTSVAWILLAAAHLVLGCQRQTTAKVLGTAGRPVFLSCSDEAAWLSVSEKVDMAAVGSEGVAAALNAKRSHLVRVTLGSQHQRIDLGVGLVTSASFDANETGRIVLLRNPGGAGQAGRLLAGTAKEGSWSSLPAPTSIVGAAFLDATRGFAWSHDGILVTADGARHWTPVALDRRRLARGSEPSGPRLGHDGALWVPAADDRGGPGGSLLRVERDGQVLEVAVWDQEAVQALAMASDGRPVVALSHYSQGGLRLLRFLGGRQPGQAGEQVLSIDASAKALVAGGGRLVLWAVGRSPPDSYFSKWPTAFWLSEDDGRTWAPWNRPSSGVEGLCLTARGFWEVSNERGFLRYSTWE